MAIVYKRINLDISVIFQDTQRRHLNHARYLMENCFLSLLALKIWISFLRSPRTWRSPASSASSGTVKVRWIYFYSSVIDNSFDCDKNISQYRLWNYVENYVNFNFKLTVGLQPKEYRTIKCIRINSKYLRLSDKVKNTMTFQYNSWFLLFHTFL